MVEIAEDGVLRPTAKFSESKISYPGRKQVFRVSNSAGEYSHDVLGLAEESFANSEPLLNPVMENGKRVGPTPTLQEIRDRAAAALARLPEDVQALGGAVTYRVEKSAALQELLQRVRSRYLPLPSGTPERR